MKWLKKFSTHAEYEAYISGDNVAYPNISFCQEPYHTHMTDIGEIVDPDAPIDYSKKPLTFEITSDGNIKWKAYNNNYKTTIEYKKNDGEWTSITSNTGNSAPSISVVSGDTVQFRGDNATYSSGSSRYYNYFSGTTCGFKVYGNIMSLIDSTGFETATTLTSAYTFYDLFYYCTGLTDASNLVLPATTLAAECYTGMFADCINLTTAPSILPATTVEYYCYNSMFYGCTSLTTAPELPATTLAQSCYNNMFIGCTGLTSAPALPATTLAHSCYQSMFSGCRSLTTAPALPATTLGYGCYIGMFSGCTSLTSAPALPATTLSVSGYASMFADCINLTTAPSILPATTLAQSCYDSMFYECRSLTSAPALPATTLATNCYSRMFGDCMSLTTAPALPATTLAQGCYQSMFSNCRNLTIAPSSIGNSATTMTLNACASMFDTCTSLTSAPELPATTLARNCYQGMFNGCTSLTSAPALPATTLTVTCYSNMFRNCTGLTTAPELPATTLADNCYNGMFNGCTSLTTAPELPATTLAPNCYYWMFSGCTSLTTAPDLMATTLGYGYDCYYQMFVGCTNLNYIKCLATDIDEYMYTSNWVLDVASTGTFVKDPTTSWTIGNDGIPTGWVIEDYSPYKETYLTFSVLSSGTINWIASDASYTTTIEYSTDSGNTWTSITSNTGGSAPSINVVAGDTVQFRGDNATYAQGNPTLTLNYNSFTSTAKFNAEGNIMSLIDSTGFIFNKTLESGNTFANLFAGLTNLISTENLFIPASALTNYCYYGMFSGCTSLTSAPELLPATIAETGCYQSMFAGCSSLRTTPTLPATTLANGCYQNMFMGCSSLTAATYLPANTLTTGCYSGMFSGCTSLTSAPDLMASTLVDSCYYEMFRGCTNLNEIKCLATSTGATNCTTNWVNGVASTGTFMKSPDMTSWTVGVNGIPTNWTVEDFENYQFEPFTIEIVSGSGGFELLPVGDDSDHLYYSKNGGEWVEASYRSSVQVANGDKIQFKGTNQLSDGDSMFGGIIHEDSSSNNLRYVFYGNIMSFAQTTGFENMTSFSSDYMAFAQFFCSPYGACYCPGLVSAEHLVLPVTALTQYCYSGMFKNCSNLTTAPELPATTLGDGYGCYSGMFQGCTSLNYIKCLATDIYDEYDYTSYWVDGVASTGTFVKNPSMTSWTRNINGIPTNWTVEDAS